MSKIIYFLLPALAYANIQIDIKASDVAEKAAVELLGTNVDIISDKERIAFKITDNELKDAAGKFSGQRPSDAFVRSPTPWNDLYSTYDWAQIKRTLKPQSAKILGIRSQPVIVATRDFINNSTVDATYSATIEHGVTNTVTSSWTTNNEITVSQEISYKIDILVAGAEGSTSFSYKHSWGQEHTESQEVTVGSSTGVKFKLEPGRSAVASLTVTQGTMDVEVDYIATLDGDVAVNYPDTYKGHHFWRYDINSVLAAGGLPRSLHFKEVLKIGFYSDGKITIDDKHSSNTLAVGKANFAKQHYYRLGK